MKLNLKKSLMMHEAFMHKVNEDAPIVVDNPTAKVDHRQSMMQDVDTIITSLEALSKNIYEEFEQDLKEVNEDDKKSTEDQIKGEQKELNQAIEDLGKAKKERDAAKKSFLKY